MNFDIFKKATLLVSEMFPLGDIESFAPFNGLYILKINRNTDPNEDFIDPFYIFDSSKNTINEFSLITDCSREQASNLKFTKIKQ